MQIYESDTDAMMQSSGKTRKRLATGLEELHFWTVALICLFFLSITRPAAFATTPVLVLTKPVVTVSDSGLSQIFQSLPLLDEDSATGSVYIHVPEKDDSEERIREAFAEFESLSTLDVGMIPHWIGVLRRQYFRARASKLPVTRKFAAALLHAVMERDINDVPAEALDNMFFMTDPDAPESIDFMKRFMAESRHRDLYKSSIDKKIVRYLPLSGTDEVNLRLLADYVRTRLCWPGCSHVCGVSHSPRDIQALFFHRLLKLDDDMVLRIVRPFFTGNDPYRYNRTDLLRTIEYQKPGLLPIIRGWLEESVSEKQ